MKFDVDFGVYKKYETRRSFYFIDETNKKYMRMPKTECNRNDGFEDPSPNIVDAVWHDLEDCDDAVTVGEWGNGEWILHIKYKGCNFGILTTELIPVPELEDVIDVVHGSN